jgi:hypothetical protein
MVGTRGQCAGEPAYNGELKTLTTGLSMRSTWPHSYLAFMAGVSSVMCSYNLINGTYACENNNTINGILKNELCYQGFYKLL